MILPERIQKALTLTRFQALIGITAGFLSIVVTVYGFFFALKPAPVTSAEIVTLVQEARTENPVPNAIVEFRTPRDILVTIVLAKDGQARQTLKEGVYRLRVTHPKFMTEVQHIQILAGASQEIRVGLAPRPFAAKAPSAAKAPPADKASPFDKASEAVKKLFR